MPKNLTNGKNTSSQVLDAIKVYLKKVSKPSKLNN